MTRTFPFARHAQICHDLDITVQASPSPTRTLPGHPLIYMDNEEALLGQLECDCFAYDLEAIASKLWIMSTYSSANVNPLHKQKIKGREIIITEDPRLHLIWIHDRIFIKPIPRYMLCYKFWEVISTSLHPSASAIRLSAFGFLRSYCHLIRHEVDLRIAQQDHIQLLPTDVSWTQFCNFVSSVHTMGDPQVSGRYQYGELRLSRLNFYAPILLRKFYYEQLHGQYGDIFGRFYSPILFAFAIVTTMLNAMQVEMAVESLSVTHWTCLWSISRWFSTLVLTVIAVFGVGLFMLWCWMIGDEWVYALRHLRPGHMKREILDVNSV